MKKRKRIVGFCSEKDMRNFLSSTANEFEIVDKQLKKLKKQIEKL